MSEIGELIIEAGVQALVIAVVNISSRAGLGIGQVGEHGPLAAFQLLGLKAGPAAPKTFNRFSAWALS
ncbi:hypothetical protein AXW84_11235 [Hymenobacter sp. PAMC 26628]|nr:hypothetical protein AXW84_11235 [Hymenobacter sp. PAMC 26628]